MYDHEYDNDDDNRAWMKQKTWRNEACKSEIDAKDVPKAHQIDVQVTKGATKKSQKSHRKEHRN